MKKFTALVVVSIAVALITNCKKAKATLESDGIVETPVVYPDYAALKTGNYWIYGRFRVEQNGQVTDLEDTDSCYIEKDTVVRGHTYFKMHKHDLIYGNLGFYLRDSLHYIIYLNGGICFSSEDFTTEFYRDFRIENTMDSINTKDTVYKRSSRMADRDLVINVPAGTFTTSNMQTSFFYYPNHANANASNPRNMNMRYAKNTGLILETERFYFTTTYVTERRLLRYHLN